MTLTMSNVYDNLYDLDNALDNLYDLDNVPDNLYDLNLVPEDLYDLGKPSKKINSGYNEFGTKGGRVSDLNHYFKQL